MEDRIRELEGEISRAETVIAKCETALQDFVSADESQRQSKELDQQKPRTLPSSRNGKSLAGLCRMRSNGRIHAATVQSLP